jgi:RHH-type transcriptional regulator, rel operon repressor / antitoxin RelB
MPRTAPVMTRVAPKTKEKLRMIAKNTNRSEAYLVNEAIENYVAVNEWQVAVIRDRLAEAEAGGETVSHEEVLRRFAAPASKAAKRIKPGARRGGR